MQIIIPYAGLNGLCQRLLRAEENSCGLDEKACELREKIEHAARSIPQGASFSFDYEEIKEFL